jgi:hypothetical protein
MPMADEIAAESALAHAAVGLDEVFLSFLQCQRLLPNFRMEVGHLCKDVREKMVKGYRVHRLLGLFVGL